MPTAFVEEFNKQSTLLCTSQWWLIRARLLFVVFTLILTVVTVSFAPLSPASVTDPFLPSSALSFASSLVLVSDRWRRAHWVRKVNVNAGALPTRSVVRALLRVD